MIMAMNMMNMHAPANINHRYNFCSVLLARLRLRRRSLRQEVAKIKRVWWAHKILKARTQPTSLSPIINDLELDDFNSPYYQITRYGPTSIPIYLRP